MIRLEPRLDEQHHRHLRRKCHWMALTRVLYSGPSPKKVLPTLDNIRTELKQSIGYTGSKGQLRKDLLYTKSAHTRCVVNQKVLTERQDVRPFAVRENVQSSCPHSIFRSHFACICHSLTTGMLSHFFMEEGSFKLANIQRLSCILLPVGFTLHKINFFYVPNMLNVYISR